MVVQYLNLASSPGEPTRAAPLAAGQTLSAAEMLNTASSAASGPALTTGTAIMVHTHPLKIRHEHKTNFHKKRHAPPTAAQARHHLQHHDNKSQTALQFAVQSVFRSPLKHKCPEHLLFKKEFFRHDMSVFGNREMTWPVLVDKANMKYKNENLERSMHKLSLWLGCATAGKMVAIMDKVLVRLKLNEHIYDALVKDYVGVAAAADPDYEKVKRAIQNHMKQYTEDRLLEKAKHGVPEGKKIEVQGKAGINQFFTDDARHTSNYCHYLMALMQFRMDKFHEFINELKNNDEDKPFWDVATKSEGMNVTLFNRLKKAYEDAQGKAAPDKCDLELESNVKRDALQKDLINKYLAMFTDFHNQVLETIAIFCNALYIPEVIPHWALAYRHSICTLANVHDKKFSCEAFIKIFEALSCIVKLVEPVAFQQDNDYTGKVKKSISDLLKSTYETSTVKLTDMLTDENLTSEEQFQKKIKVKFEKAFSAPGMQDVVHKILLDFPEHNWHVPAPEHGKHDHAHLVDVTAQHLRIDDYFYNLPAYHELRYVLKYGKKIIGYFSDVLDGRSDVYKRLDFEQAVSLSFAMAGIRIPHGPLQYVAPKLTVNTIQVEQVDYAGAITSVEQQFKDFKMENIKSELKASTIATRFRVVKQDSKYYDEANEIQLATKGLNLSTDNKMTYGLLKHLLYNCIFSHASSLAAMRIIKDAAEKQSFETFLKNGFQLGNHVTALWYREGFNLDMHTIFYPEYDPKFHGAQKQQYTGKGELGGIDFLYLERAVEYSAVYLRQYTDGKFITEKGKDDKGNDADVSSVVTIAVGCHLYRDLLQKNFGSLIHIGKLAPYKGLLPHSRADDKCNPVLDFMPEAWEGDACTKKTEVQLGHPQHKAYVKSKKGGKKGSGEKHNDKDKHGKGKGNQHQHPPPHQQPHQHAGKGKGKEKKGKGKGKGKPQHP